MSYQHSDEELVAPMRSMRGDDREQPLGLWKYIAVAASLGAAGLFAVSMSGTGFEQLEKPISRLQLAKNGEIQYTSLSDTEMSDLFDEFISVFGRTVSPVPRQRCFDLFSVSRLPRP
jgi:hypothetical protein